MNKRIETTEIWRLVDPVVDGAGLDLIEVQWGREQGGFVLRLFIDRREGVPGAPAVTHEDCERVSRDVSATLDVADVIPHAYNLEVSSPGLDRPLRREQDFARFTGHQARIRLAGGVEGRRNFSGTLRGAHGGEVEIECDGRVWRVPVADVVKANLVPDWDAEFARGQGPARPGHNKERSAS